MVDLSDFGMTTDPDIPKFQKKRRILVRHDGETREAGWWGVSPTRLSRLFYTERDSYNHRIRGLEPNEGGSYAISTSAIRRLEGLKVKRVLVVETDKDQVLEFQLEAFLRNELVPDKFLADPDDPQRYATKAQADYAWSVGARELLIPRDVDVFDPEA